MDTVMPMRRQFLAALGSASIAACSVPVLLRVALCCSGQPREGSAPHAPTSTGAAATVLVAADEPGVDPVLVQQASAWIERWQQQQRTLLLLPVSRLQGEFRLGYARARALAALLEQRGEWSVFIDHTGTRSARIHPVSR